MLVHAAEGLVIMAGGSCIKRAFDHTEYNSPRLVIMAGGHCIKRAFDHTEYNSPQQWRERIILCGESNSRGTRFESSIFRMERTSQGGGEKRLKCCERNVQTDEDLEE